MEERCAQTSGGPIDINSNTVVAYLVVYPFIEIVDSALLYSKNTL